ncbi:MAG: VOC family protein [Acidimicrobiia bacterium]
MADGAAQLTPYLFYEDVPAALEWLATAFGFEERMRVTAPDGTITHAEMQMGEAVIMMGCPSPDYRNPKRLGQTTLGLYVHVAGVDAHCERARAAGATIEAELADQPYGDRVYGVLDPEGHQWWFAQTLRTVDAAELERAYAEQGREARVDVSRG